MKQKSLKSLKAKAWRLFSEWIRRKDADEGGTVACFTCGALRYWKELHAGHFVGGRRNAVLFNEEIVKPQCILCNIYLAGNYHEYTLRMIDLHGREKVREFLQLRHKTLKYTRSDMEDLIEDLKGKLERLEAV